MHPSVAATVMVLSAWSYGHSPPVPSPRPDTTAHPHEPGGRLTASFDPESRSLTIASRCLESAWTPTARLLLVGGQAWELPIKVPGAPLCSLEVIPLAVLPGGGGEHWSWTFRVPPRTAGSEFLIQDVLLLEHPRQQPLWFSGAPLAIPPLGAPLRIAAGGTTRASRAALYADGSVQCSGADDLSNQVGTVVLRPTRHGISFHVVLTNAAPKWTYYVELSRDGTCHDPQRYFGFTTNRLGAGVFHGVYSIGPGSHAVLVDVVSDPPASVPPDPTHREIAPGGLLQVSVR